MKNVLTTSGESRGSRSKLAKFLNCQTGYIYQVLRGNTHFSLEHAVKINTFFEHDEEEKHFFMLLVQFERSGNQELSSYYLNQINEIHKKRSEITSRIAKSSELTLEDQMEYYSHWYYSAIHVIVSIADFQSVSQISERLNLDILTVKKSINFLVQKKLIIEKDGNYIIGPARIHLSSDSPMISKHHTNWKINALKSLDKINNENMHYSSVVTLSNEDFLKIKEILLKSIENIEPILRESKEEDIFSMSLDFYRV